MNTSNMLRALFAALTGLAFAAITQVSYASRDVASETQIDGVMEASQVAPAPAIAERRPAGRGSPLTLYMQDSTGNPFRLVHVQGTGWRYASGWKSPDKAPASLLRKVAFWSTPPSRPAVSPTPEGEPLTVFIDGPTGFTYVWDRAGGWTFVGKIADRSP